MNGNHSQQQKEFPRHGRCCKQTWHGVRQNTNALILPHMHAVAAVSQLLTKTVSYTSTGQLMNANTKYDSRSLNLEDKVWSKALPAEVPGRFLEDARAVEHGWTTIIQSRLVWCFCPIATQSRVPDNQLRPWKRGRKWWCRY